MLKTIATPENEEGRCEISIVGPPPKKKKDTNTPHPWETPRVHFSPLLPSGRSVFSGAASSASPPPPGAAITTAPAEAEASTPKVSSMASQSQSAINKQKTIRSQQPSKLNRNLQIPTKTFEPQPKSSKPKKSLRIPTKAFEIQQKSSSTRQQKTSNSNNKKTTKAFKSQQQPSNPNETFNSQQKKPSTPDPNFQIHTKTHQFPPRPPTLSWLTPKGTSGWVQKTRLHQIGSLCEGQRLPELWTQSSGLAETSLALCSCH